MILDLRGPVLGLNGPVLGLGPDLRAVMSNLQPEMAYLRPVMAGLKPERLWKGRGDARTDERTNGQTKVPLCSIGLCPLWGRCPKSQIWA